MYFFYRAFGLFIRTHTVYTAHEDIAKLQRVEPVLDQWQCQLKARVFLQTAQIDRDDRNVRIAGFFQCTPDEADVIAGAAAAAGLGD